MPARGRALPAVAFFEDNDTRPIDRAGLRLAARSAALIVLLDDARADDQFWAQAGAGLRRVTARGGQVLIVSASHDRQWGLTRWMLRHRERVLSSLFRGRL